MLEWTPEEASLLQDQHFSAAASVYISREAWETQNHQTFSSISLLGTLGPGDRRLCETCACVIHSCIIIHDQPFSVPSEESLRITLPEHQGTGYFMRSECIKLVLVSFTLISHHDSLVLSILQKCLRGVHVLREALVFLLGLR